MEWCVIVKSITKHWYIWFANWNIIIRITADLNVVENHIQCDIQNEIFIASGYSEKYL